MAIVAVFDFSEYGIEKYDEVLAAAGPAVWDQPARSHHVCYQGTDGWAVVDVWDDEASFAAFGQDVIGPSLAAVGIDAPAPQIHRVHNEHDRRDAAAANVATVAGVYGAFGRGDIPAIVEQLADDVDWEAGRTDDHGIPWLRPGRGKDHVLSFFGTLSDLEFKRFEPTSISGQGDVVVAVIELESVVLSTGRAIVDLEVHVWTFGDDGKVRAFRHVVDTAAHRAAVVG